jgi:hypothetical protein
VLRLRRPVSPVLFRAFEGRKRIAATIVDDAKRGVVISWGDWHFEDPDLAPGSQIRRDILPLAGAIGWHERDFAFFTAEEVAQLEADEARAAAATAQRRADAEARSLAEAHERADRNRAANAALALPFAWHPGYRVALAGCYDTVRTGGTGATKATVDHVVLEEPFAIGRLKRDAGELLCGAPPGRNGYSGITHETLADTCVTCRACRRVIARITRTRQVEQVPDPSPAAPLGTSDDAR